MDVARFTLYLAEGRYSPAALRFFVVFRNGRGEGDEVSEVVMVDEAGDAAFVMRKKQYR